MTRGTVLLFFTNFRQESLPYSCLKKKVMLVPREETSIHPRKVSDILLKKIRQNMVCRFSFADFPGSGSLVKTCTVKTYEQWRCKILNKY
jgi:hypothetical protein